MSMAYKGYLAEPIEFEPEPDVPLCAKSLACRT